MSLLTGLFAFRMKAQGVEHPVIAEIRKPGIPTEHVVRLIRGEWANLIAPAISQNRIECLGWKKIEEIPAGWNSNRPRGAEPFLLWQPPA